MFTFTYRGAMYRYSAGVVYTRGPTTQWAPVPNSAMYASVYAYAQQRFAA